MKANEFPQSGELDGASLQCQTNPSLRILVAEDNADVRRLNTQVLVRFGYHVDAAEDGAVAWDNLQRNSYDLLVTDNNMPKVTGVELIKKVRAARMALPVIMATAVSPKRELARYPWLQPAATLLKPYSIAELLGTVQAVLSGTSGARDQIAPPTNWQNQPSADGLRT